MGIFKSPQHQSSKKDPKPSKTSFFGTRAQPRTGEPYKKGEPFKNGFFNDSEPFFKPQAKLKVGESNDKFEQEADHVANQVVNNSKGDSVQKKNGDEEIQQKPIASQITPYSGQTSSNVGQKKGLIEDKPVQKAPEEEPVQIVDKPVQKKDAVEEEPVQKAPEEEPVQKKEEEEPVQMKEEEEPVQMAQEEEAVQKKDTVEEEPVQKAEEEEPVQMKEEEEPVQMAQDEEAVQKKDAVEEEPVQKAEEEEPVQMKEDEEPVQAKEEEEVQKKAASGSSQSTSIESRLNSSKGSGKKLSGKAKNEMESGFGTDFSNVNIHTDQNAIQMSEELGAKAFAHGNDVYFNKGQYNPESSEGKHLLAHELTHTIQQGGGNQLKSNMQRKSTLKFPSTNYRQGSSKSETIQKISKVYNSSNVIQPFIGAGASGFLAYQQISKFRKMQAKYSSIRGRINFLRMRSGLFNMASGGKGQIQFTHAQWNKLQQKLGKSSSVATRASSFPMLGFTSGVSPALSTFLSSGVVSGGGVIVSAGALEGLLGSLAGTVAGGIAIALGEILLVLAVIALIIYILYLIVVIIIEVVDTIAEAIEQLRKVAPILWPLTLPMPGSIGHRMPRASPPYKRFTNGGQAKVRQFLKQNGITGMHAHHIQPLFLGGLDTVANVKPWPHYLHVLGHSSLAMQPQLATLGLNPYLYSHRPPQWYYIAGRKP